jgi:DNA repair protein RadC
MKSQQNPDPQTLVFGIPTNIWDLSDSISQSLFIGSGPGLAAYDLIKDLAGRCRQFYYLDQTEAAAKRATQLFPFDSLKCLTSPATDIPLDNESVDLVVSFWSAHHASDPRKFFLEMLRVLKPGASLIMVDGINRKGNKAQELHRKIHNLSIAIDQARGRQHIPMLSPEEIVELAQLSGFQGLVTQEILDTSSTLTGDKLGTFRNEAERLLTKVYPREIGEIANGEKRFGDRIKRLAEELQRTALELHPYFILGGRKPKGKVKGAKVNDRSKGAAKKDARKTFRYRLLSDQNGYPLRFRDLPAELKPRERMIMHGPEVLKNHELLAILIVTGTTKENVIELSKRLISEYGSRAIAQERSVRRLMETLGLGQKKACQIVAAFELGRRFFEEPRSKAPTILAPEDAYEYLKDMKRYTREHFRGLFLNTRGRVIRDETISIGTLTMSVVHPREIFLPAVEFSAAAIILAHNHPSGDPTPSEEDLEITRQIVEAGKVMGIEVFDHIIIGEEGYVSLKREGKL